MTGLKAARKAWISHEVRRSQEGMKKGKQEGRQTDRQRGRQADRLCGKLRKSWYFCTKTSLKTTFKWR
jgi:predicted transposase YdaD